MDHVSSALLALHRDTRDDLAFSALPHAPRRAPEPPGALRRTLGRGLARTANRLEPGIALTAEPAPHRGC